MLWLAGRHHRFPNLRATRKHRNILSYPPVSLPLRKLGKEAMTWTSLIRYVPVSDFSPRVQVFKQNKNLPSHQAIPHPLLIDPRPKIESFQRNLLPQTAPPLH